MQNFIYTSESVTAGHPDKICDQISDALVDQFLTQDPLSHVACETMVTTGQVVIAGEVTTKAYVDILETARNTIRRIGYAGGKYGFDADNCGILTSIHEQSPDIAQGVNEGNGLHLEQGAGDQGMMFGYACNETPELMPLPIALAHKLVKRLNEAREQGEITYLGPDGKSQVSVEYQNGRPVRVATIVVSAHHDAGILHSQIRSDLLEKVIRPVAGAYLDDKTVFHINPTGEFSIGGPTADSGLTGRKIIVDTYGGMGHHGGGCFSGKDPSKVDRSAAYAGRYVAKNLVAAGLAEKCEVQVAYAIGVARPVSVNVNTFGTGQVADERILQAVNDTFDLRPAQIIEDLRLLRPIYEKTAAYGHFGREDEDFAWEATDRAEQLKQYLNNSNPTIPANPQPTAPQNDVNNQVPTTAFPNGSGVPNPLDNVQLNKEPAPHVSSHQDGLNAFNQQIAAANEIAAAPSGPTPPPVSVPETPMNPMPIPEASAAPVQNAPAQPVNNAGVPTNNAQPVNNNIPPAASSGNGPVEFEIPRA